MLALLVEAGEAQTVVAAGEEWLSTHRRDSRVRDVALSTALAHRAVAEACVKKQGDAASAAGMLRVAGELLRRHRAAPGLQAEVASALAELQPSLACQLVALPLEQFRERERGVQVGSCVCVCMCVCGLILVGLLDCLASHAADAPSPARPNSSVRTTRATQPPATLASRLPHPGGHRGAH